MKRKKMKSIVATGRGVITSVYHSNPAIAEQQRKVLEGTSKPKPKKKSLFSGFLR